MRIGFATVYSWRPHVEHLVWLARLVRGAGHEALFLSCDGDLPACYTRQLRPNTGRLANCWTCRIGGVRSFEGRNVSSIGALAGTTVPPFENALQWSRSSAATLGRFETQEDFEGAEFERLSRELAPASAAAYAAARNWIERERLDAICVFNGRMDATRAIVEAAKDAGIRFISLERTWFGDGLQLLPDETCLGLRNVDRLMAEWRDRPLRADQAARAAMHIASRFTGRNVNEWRAYNRDASTHAWPVEGGNRRILLLPGSRNELYDHPDWESRWPDTGAAYDALIDQLGLSPRDMVLRCHPNWAENIGPCDGRLSEQFFTDWADRRGIAVIPAAAKASTQGLIEQADAVVVAGSSAGLEAGILGKQVIAVAPSIYQEAGFQTRAYDPDEMREVALHAGLDERPRLEKQERIIRQALRFAYTMIYRIPQYVDSVRCMTTTRYRYDEAADAERFVRLVRTGVLEADDDRYAETKAQEDEVLSLIRQRDWQALVNGQVPAPRAEQTVSRRFIYRGMDNLRDRLPRGDQWAG